MTGEQIFIAKVPQFEDTIPWLYLDNDEPANVTVGIGCEIGLEEAMTLPFSIGPYLATPTQIQQEFMKVRGMNRGERASAYRYNGCLTLSTDAIADLLQRRTAAAVADLNGIFPDFPEWPPSCRAAAINMRFQLGDGVPGPPPTGLHAYQLWIAAARVHNWLACAQQSAINDWNVAFDIRNRWMHEMFAQGAV
jgi:hypothetical protein